MYVGQFEPVPLPETGKLHIQKNGYVYWSNFSKWDSKKKRNIDNRVSIGKIVPENPKLMYPNKKYFDIFGITRPDEKRDNNMKSSIRELRIENFRGIKAINLNDMRRLVLLSGKNNVGKSSILEAIFLLMDHLNPDSFKRMNNFRGLDIPPNGVNIWEPLFYQMNPNNSIKICANRSNDNLSLSYIKDDSYIPASNINLPQDVVNSFQSSAKKDYTLQFDFNITGDTDYTETGHFTTNENSILREIANNNNIQQIMPLTRTTFVNNNYLRTDRATLDRMGKAEIEGKKESIIGFLQHIDSSISDITTLSVNGIPQLYVNSNGKLLPIQFSGDGINKLLYIVLCIMDAKDGIVLIDEVDSGFHFSMFEVFWKIIANVSREYNCQVIATTHSYENIKGAVLGVQEFPEDFSYYRLGYDKEHLEAYRYSYDLLESAFRSDMEVR